MNAVTPKPMPADKGDKKPEKGGTKKPMPFPPKKGK